MGGSKRVFGVWIAALFVGALAFKLFEFLMVNGSQYAFGAFETVLDVVILFVITGVGPMIWWAFRRFQPSYCLAPLTLWSLLLVLIGGGGILALNFMI